MISAQDRRFSRRAIELACRGAGRASPNPTVGCVIVQDGRVVGEGFHEYECRDHAEVVATRRAGELARGATAYISLEPCSHRGRTPPCAELLVAAGIRRAVVPLADPNPMVSGRGFELLRSNGIEVDLGYMKDEAAELIEPFACHVTTGRPLVVGKVGMSLDGRIAAQGGPVRRITSREAGEFTQKLRLRLDALLVGVGTVVADDPQLTYRGSEVKARPLIRVILDSRLRMSRRARVFESVPSSPVLIFCGPRAPARSRRELEASGAEVIPVALQRGRVDLHSVLEELGRRRVLGVLVEGGSETHWSFLSGSLLDKFYFIIAPLVLGGTGAVPAVGGEGYPGASTAPGFRIRKRFELGPDLALETYPCFSRSIISPWQPEEMPPSDARDSSKTSGRR
jgi:diaminohydroxyphosphoribosylaminopyrimidine deaminase/5-amino-6-(5-phosphoribosylamino)uracil reductase